MPAPPPPPPPGFQASAQLSKSKSSSGGANNHSALLSSIREQPKLKKVDRTLINDRSEPLASSKPKNKPIGGTPTGDHQQSGLPKLKTNFRPGGEASAAPSFNAFDIQEELRKRLTTDRSTNRGPAPPAPIRTQVQNELSSLHAKNSHNTPTNMSNQAHTYTKSCSNGNNSSNNSDVSTKSRNNNSVPISSPVPKQNFGKPHLAPKPPILDKPMTHNQNSGKLRKSHSVRLPNSPMSLAPAYHRDNNNPSLPHMSDMEKSKTLAASTSQLVVLKNRSNNGRPTVPPPSIPIQAIKVKPPNHAPPPPPPPPATIPQVPQHAPPPPPHRTVPPVPSRLQSSVPNGNAPAPPPRNSSIRPVLNGTSFENRFQFHPVSDFPPPLPFRNISKIYTTRQANKQQAPQPPNQINLTNSNRLWESSTC